MRKNVIDAQISRLTVEINKSGDDCMLFYNRGYYYFLLNDYAAAKQDYLSAISLGLDATEFPYYSFTDSNSMRREFLLPEKILLVLIIIMVFVAIFFQAVSFINGVRI